MTKGKEGAFALWLVGVVAGIAGTALGAEIFALGSSGTISPMAMVFGPVLGAAVATFIAWIGGALVEKHSSPTLIAFWDLSARIGLGVICLSVAWTIITESFGPLLSGLAATVAVTAIMREHYETARKRKFG